MSTVTAPTIHCIPVLSDNYVWLIEGDDRATVIIDAGEAGPVIEAIEARGLKPVATLITHHHGDHVQGLAALAQRFPMAVYGPDSCRRVGVETVVGEGDRFSVPGVGEFAVMATPGHTQDHLSYVSGQAIFCGDTLFTGGCGRLFEGTAAQMLHSLDRLAALGDEIGPEATIYCGHEYTTDSLRFAAHAEPDNPDIAARVREVATKRSNGEPTASATMDLEKRTNPFLRVRVPALREAIERYVGECIEDDIEAFAQLRHWKDDFDGLARL
ncbi:hydroxyacylglutathione hydrolase [Guyparkeria halophila]|uniref:Hydroxyacylglutathione hydrolase n=1 Tax=Guyparkeria halophila TaxID=47960 RepID=A0ABZ0YY77_9GAMM|nr:hydroxyacylglutathione hydrolase [Guyparkeria halophila]WQH17114.1 hydroxyacylglutathione hydrolase [Guyparkeria halophila]